MATSCQLLSLFALCCCAAAAAQDATTNKFDREECETVPGDITGDNVPSVGGGEYTAVRVSSADTCCEICRDVTDCGRFSFDTDSGTCYLKNADSGDLSDAVIARDGFVSGAVAGSDPPPAPPSDDYSEGGFTTDGPGCSKLQPEVTATTDDTISLSWTASKVPGYFVEWYDAGAKFPTQQAVLTADAAIDVGPLSGAPGDEYDIEIKPCVSAVLGGQCSPGSDSDACTVTATTSGGSTGGGNSTDGGDVITCPDIPPDTVYTCEQQASWSKCDEPWMLDPTRAPTPPGSFCTKTCGRCDEVAKPTSVTPVDVRQVEFVADFADRPIDYWNVDTEAEYKEQVAGAAGTSPSLVLIRPPIEPSPSVGDAGSALTTEVSFKLPENAQEADDFEQRLKDDPQSVFGGEAEADSGAVKGKDAEVAVPQTKDTPEVTEDAIGAQLQGRAAEGKESAQPKGTLPPAGVAIPASPTAAGSRR